MSRRSVAVSLMVFVLVVYGVAFLFSDRFPGLLPVGFSELGDIAPLEGPTAITEEQFTEPVQPEDPSVPGEPSIIAQILIFFEPVIFFTGAIFEALSGAVAQAVSSISGTFSAILGPLVSLATFNLPALTGNVVFDFIRIAVVGVIVLTLAFLIFDIVRSIIPFLSSG